MMFQLEDDQLTAVVGGATSGSEIAQVVLRACNGLADSAKITVTLSRDGAVKVSGTGVSNGQSVTVETTCGDARKEANKARTAGSNASFFGVAGSMIDDIYIVNGWGDAGGGGGFTDPSSAGLN